MHGTDQEQLQLANASTIAVVGISPRPERPSYYVARYLQQRGYRIIPVNPTLESVLGERCYPDLKSVPERVDLVQIFRRSEYVGPIVDDAIAIGAKYVWMQDGVVDHDAAARAREEATNIVGLSLMYPDAVTRAPLGTFSIPHSPNAQPHRTQ